jgi:hypothetical protein
MPGAATVSMPPAAKNVFKIKWPQVPSFKVEAEGLKRLISNFEIHQPAGHRLLQLRALYGTARVHTVHMCFPSTSRMYPGTSIFLLSGLSHFASFCAPVVA